MAVESFQVEVSGDVLADLHRRLDNTRWPQQLPGIDDWSRGVPVAAARELADEWRAFDWRSAQEELNAWPQFTATVDGARIHFIHAESEREDALPLLLLHGWPGSVVEFLDVLRPLTDPEGDHPAFHVVAPSHPGTGFSGPTSEAGWGVPRTARAYAELMGLLGYDRYVVQGGDHGAVLAPHIGRIDAAHVMGIHVNAATIGFIPMGPVDDAFIAAATPTELGRLERIQQFMNDEMGYNVIQATRPQTIGYGLNDSAVAQLTWIAEKFHDWSGDPARFDEPRFRERMLANATVWWATQTATSAAMNIYAEYGDLFGNPQASFANSGVPTAVACFAGDVSIRAVSEASNTIVRWTDLEVGGHFAALEDPDAFVTELRAFVEQLTGPEAVRLESDLPASAG